MRVAHFTFDFSLGRERCDRVDHDQVHRPRADDHVAYFQCLLSRGGLGYQQFIRVHAQRLGVDRVERMLSIDERAGTAALLRLGNRLQGQRGLSG